MKGHIRPRGKDTWAIVIDIGADPATGKRRQKWHTFHGKKRDAETELTRLLHEVNTNSYTEPSKVTVAEFLEKWLTTKAKNRLSRRSFEEYQSAIRLHLNPYLGQIPLVKLGPVHIEEAYAKALGERADKEGGGRSPTTIRKAHVILKAALKQAVIWRMLTHNPADAVDHPKIAKPKHHVLDEDQTMDLLGRLHGSDLYMPCMLAVATGMRRGEILALRWKDIDFRTGTIHVRQALEESDEAGIQFKEPKTEKSRRPISMPEFAIDELRTHRKEQTSRRVKAGPGWQDLDLVCDRGDGLYIRPSLLSLKFMRFMTHQDLPRVKFHELRHGHATHLIRAGVPAKVVSERLGHSGIGITMDIYTDVLPGMQQDAADRLNAALKPPTPAKQKA